MAEEKPARIVARFEEGRRKLGELCGYSGAGPGTVRMLNERAGSTSRHERD